MLHYYYGLDRGSSVCKATRYGLEDSGFEIRVEARFSAPGQTGPGDNQASRRVSIGSFRKVKQPMSGFTHPSSSSAESKERIDL
jgi:hypothetical protein